MAQRERALEHLRRRTQELGADALLISQPANVRYLSGFTSPEDGRVLITSDKALLLTDGRYIAQAGEESALEADIAESSQKWPERLKELLNGQRLAVEAEHVTLALQQNLKDLLGHEPIAGKAFLEAIRMVKGDDELSLLRQAAELTDRAFTHILNHLQAGVKEVEIALELERFMRLEGAEGKSFSIIVASGVRSAMPHGVASNKVIGQGELVTLDFGAIIEGYHADMTRTVAVGDISDAHRRIYEAVLDAQERALAALEPGKSGRQMDAVAREALEEAGLGEYFSHSLGHGVGLEIHEGPRLAKTSEQLLEPGMTATIEPGAYIPGDAGVRIEDLAIITNSGHERLSKSSKDFIQL